MTTQIEILGIRHHGPGSARSVRAALDELEPDSVVIEGAPELDGIIELAASPDLVPPVAGLVYVVDQPSRAVFYPLAVFSPEWVALRWALGRGVPVRFADLPAAISLAPPPTVDTAPERASDDGSDEEAVDEEAVDDEVIVVTTARPEARSDVIGTLAALAGYDDPERWWEDAIEHRAMAGSTLERFGAVRAAMAQFRADEDARSEEVGEPRPLRAENLRREAAMRKVLREEVTALRERVAVVCGAYHAPALQRDAWPNLARDNATLKGLKRAKVTATWVPWTANRLAFRSGYGAGVTSPGWYQHLFVTEQDVVPAWFARVAGALRDEQLDASTASLVDATRLAVTLASLRGRPSPGLAELNDATTAVLCDGSTVPLQIIADKLIVGEALGAVPGEAPMVPLASDLAKTQRHLRMKPSVAKSIVTFDLRKERDLAKSVFLHRLALLDIDWGAPAEVGRTTGTFKEAWELAWRPELAVAVIEASTYGTTVEGAAATKVADDAASAPDLTTLSDLLQACLLAELPGALGDVVRILAERTAHQHDTAALLGTVEPLARTLRYGDVRGVDLTGVRSVIATVVVRASIGLGPACSALDDAAAERMRGLIEGASHGIGLLDDPALRAPFLQALVGLAQTEHIHGSVGGRVNRLLLDAGSIDVEEAGARLSRRLSVAADSSGAANWLDGFLAGDALLLLHDPELLATIDTWVTAVGDETFEDLLPLLRRTFSRFEPPERRKLGDHLAHLGRPGRPESGRGTTAAEEIDLDRATAAIRKVASLVGWEVTP